MFSATPFCLSTLLRHVLLGFSADELGVVPRVFVYLLNVYKFCMWGARIDFRFMIKRPSAVEVIECVKSRVRFCLPFFFRRFRSDHRRRFFFRRCGARGVVASLVGDCLVVQI